MHGKSELLGVGAQDRIHFRVRYIEGDLVPSEVAQLEQAERPEGQLAHSHAYC